MCTTTTCTPVGTCFSTLDWDATSTSSILGPASIVSLSRNAFHSDGVRRRASAGATPTASRLEIAPRLGHAVTISLRRGTQGPRQGLKRVHLGPPENIQSGIPAEVSARSGRHRIFSGMFLCDSANRPDACPQRARNRPGRTVRQLCRRPAPFTAARSARLVPAPSPCPTAQPAT